MDKMLIEGVCTRPEGVPCLLDFNPEMDCGDCEFYDDHIEAVKWDEWNTFNPTLNFEGSSIQRWELNHGIVRVVRGDCEYVTCTNFQKFQTQMEAEKRAELRQYIADRQAEAYLGG